LVGVEKSGLPDTDEWIPTCGEGGEEEIDVVSKYEIVFVAPETGHRVLDSG